MKNNGQTQKKTGYVLLIIIGILLLIVALMAVYLILDQTLLQHNQEVVEEVETTVETEEVQEETETVEEATKEVDVSQVLQDYYEELLAHSEYPIDYDREYTASYENKEDNDYVYAECGYVENLDGPVAYDIRDYDHDDADEMLILAVVLKDGQQPDRTLELQMYEIEDQAVRLAASVETCQKAIGGYDIQSADYYIKEGGSSTYIAESATDTMSVMADGTKETLRVLHYDGEDFIDDAYQSFSGSDFSGLEDSVAETAALLDGLGFRNSAARLTTSLDFEPEDKMESLFLVRGANQELYNQDSQMWTYYEAQDISVLGEVTYSFYHNLEEYYEKNRITDYTTQIDDFSVSQDDVTVKASFERITFEGNNATNIKWLNDQIIQMEETYKNSLESIERELENLLESPFDDKEWDYQPYSLESVYYNDDGVVSVGYSWDWYMGGVNNYGWQSVNCNIYTKERYWLSDILGVDWDTAWEQVKQALVDQADYEEEYIPADESILYDVPFYFDEDTVTVCFDSYSLNQGTGGLQITLPRN